MRMCIVGAGAIGGLLGVRLAVSGQEVSVFARRGNLEAIRARGLRLVEPDGTEVVAANLRTSDQLADLGPQDVILMALKAHQIRDIAEQLPILYHDDTIVIPMQNGLPWWFFQKFGGQHDGRRIQALDPDGTLERCIPTDRIVASIAYPAAERDASGVVRLVEGDKFPVGELDGSRSSRVTEIAHALTSAGFKSRVLTDIRQHLWTKAWGNLAMNPISALTGTTLAEICRHPAARALAAQMMLESAEVAKRLGLHLRLSVEQRIDGAAQVGEHKTSMLQDVEAHRGLEIEPLIGSFVELGQLTDTPMPATEAVYALVSLLDARLTGAIKGF
jgi:2-dehydropantoate 2-reductase